VRRQEQSKANYVSLSNGPLFESPFERRRLRLLSGLFTSLQFHGMNVIARKKDPDYFEITVGELSISTEWGPWIGAQKGPLRRAQWSALAGRSWSGLRSPGERGST